MYTYKTMTRRLRELSLGTKIAIILLSMALVRIGSNIPLPFVNRLYIQSLLDTDGLSFLNSITGGSMLQMSFFALSVSPYITASIIIQLLTVVFPFLEEMRKDGKTGMDEYQKIIRFTGVGLGVIQAASLAIGLGAQGLLDPYNWKTVLLAAIIWSVGGIVIIYLGEFLEKLELGSGISMILFCNIVSGIPSDLINFMDFANTGTRVNTIFKYTIGIVFVLAIICISVICQNTAKNLTVVQTRKTAAGGKSTFPIPLFTTSVMPVIFAGSILSLPIMIAQFIPGLYNGTAGEFIRACNTSMWFKPESLKYSVGAILYVILSMLFTYFYLSIGFNPAEIADNLKKQGAVISGVRPGKPTATLIEKLSTKVALRGNCIMTAIILATYAVCNISGLGSLTISGTSAFICVNVALEQYKKMKSALALNPKRRKSYLIPSAAKRAAKASL